MNIVGMGWLTTKQKAGLGVMSIVLVGLIVSLVLVGERQVIQKRAAGTGEVNLLFSPSASNSSSLLLVSFYNGAISALNTNKLSYLNQSPYDGAAFWIISTYDTGAIPTFTDLAGPIELIKNNSNKQIWPWIYLNRIVEKSDAPEGSYFERINGMDLDDEVGALSDFLNNWRLGIRVAKETNSGGIVFDHETYNNGFQYRRDILILRVWELAEERNETIGITIQKLTSIGRRMAQIIKEEGSPNMKILILDASLRPISNNLYPDVKFTSIGYIILGLLEEIKAQNLPIEVIDGGEGGIGYCFYNLEGPDDPANKHYSLSYMINQRSNHYSQILALYRNFSLAGTVAPWFDTSWKVTNPPSSWWNRTPNCKDSTFTTIESFVPLFQKLHDNFSFVWIMAASALGYSPYDSQDADRINPILASVFGKSYIPCPRGNLGNLDCGSDGCIDTGDFELFRPVFGQSVSTLFIPSTHHTPDLVEDSANLIDTADYEILRSNFGRCD